ncbi:DUF4276 family protein [Pedobacter glucosidilyticus]|uniref:DUF4276 family protein n=1 Tax=Pedobacter glucosidilyticus TaxID=1122941 RepID=UPI0026EEC894|nr:DUF4276 family protein [Pedobacter glucosidilyticus]
MIQVGLVGEDPNDTAAIKNLLSSKYEGKLQFKPLLKGIKGYQLDNPKTSRALEQEVKRTSCKIIIFIRDLDGFDTQQDFVERKKTWFKKLSKKEDVLLLNVWELEALILADIAAFNNLYKCNISFTGNPMRQKDPKEFLKSKTANGKRQYKESHAPEVFQSLNIDLLIKNCAFFKEFMLEFEGKLSA